jgi:hypothetical protein
MLRNVTKKLNYITRWLLLIGVLGGLFFSNGEGIQLFPFPDSTEKNSLLFQAEINKNYSISAHNSTFVQFKAQKDCNHAVTQNLPLNNFQATKFRVLSTDQVRCKSNFYYNLRAPILQSDRASPII